MIQNKWHAYLGVRKRSASWHSMAIRDELEEYYAATSLLNKWSKAADVHFAHGQAKWGGYKLRYPLSPDAYLLGKLYMYPKYTLRFWFFRRAGKKLGNPDVREVRNPRMVLKVREIAEQYGFDTKAFERVCKKQLKYWPLLP